MKVLGKRKLRILAAALFILAFYIYIKSRNTSITKRSIPTNLVINDTYTPVHKRVLGNPTASVSQVINSFFDSHYGKEETIDFNRLGYQLRFFKELYHHFQSESNNSILAKKISDVHEGFNKNSLRKWIDHLNDQLFPWIKPGFSSSIDLGDSFGGDGIVICVFDGYVDMALINLLIIREFHKSRLPIEIFYMGEKDLSLENQKLLKSTISMSTTRDLYEIFNPELINTTGWSVKAFALLASSFQNAILMDADVVFLQPPEILLESELFQTKRALFYQDRTMYSVTLEMLDMANNWIKKMAPKPFKSEYQSNRFLKSTSSHQQESGVVVIDKKARFMGLLSICILNVNRVRDVAYGHMYGDKETFWIGFEIVGEPYAFNPYIPGAMSDKMTVDQSNNSEICSVQLIHVDENYEPIWINGGLTLNKHNGASTVPDFRYYLIETNQKGHQQATWHLKDGWFFCLTSKNSLVEFPDSSIQVFQFAKPYLEDLLSKKL